MLTVVEPFAGAGGMALGLKAAGFASVHASDQQGDAVTTLRQIAPHAQQLTLTLESARALAADLEGQPISLLAAGVPCQPFSSAGKGLANADPRDGFPAFLALARMLQPHAVLIENVPGLASKAHREYFNLVLEVLEGLGYATAWKILCAADFGVPQRRMRLFIVGFLSRRAAARFSWPTPTHSEASLVHAKWVSGEYWEGIAERREAELRYDHGVANLDDPCCTVKGGGNVDASGHLGGGCPPAIPVYVQGRVFARNNIGAQKGPSEKRALYDRCIDDEASVTIRAHEDLSPVQGQCIYVAELPSGAPFDPKHLPNDPDAAAAAVRSGGDGHDAPPVYVQGITRKPDDSGSPQIYAERSREGVPTLEGSGVDAASLALAGAHGGGNRRWIEASSENASPRITRREALILKRIEAGQLDEELKLPRWRTVRDALGGSTVIGAGTNPHGKAREEERERREITDEASPVVAAVEVGNRGPWCVVGGGGHAGDKAYVERHIGDITDSPSTTIPTVPQSSYGPFVLAHRKPLDVESPSPVVGAGGTETGGADPFRHHALDPATLERIAKKREGSATEGALEFPDDIDKPVRAIGANNMHGQLRESIIIDGDDLARVAPGDLKRFENQRARPHQQDEAGMTVKGMGGRAPELLEGPPRLRRLTQAECAALQGFPAWYRFSGSKTAQFRQIGNALPPALAEAVGRAIKEAMK